MRIRSPCNMKVCAESVAVPDIDVFCAVGPAIFFS